jgi:hypothetical protein
MATAQSLDGFATKSLRDFAKSGSKALQKRSELLDKFSSGGLSTSDFAGESIKLSLAEAVQYAQDALEFGEACAEFLSGLGRSASASVRSAATRSARPARRSAGRARTKRARRPKS